MKVVQQFNDAWEGLGIEIVRVVSGAIAAHQVGQELALVAQVTEGIPQRRANIRAKALIVGDWSIVV